jgi:Ca2+-binding RTX toxin-like protein
MLIGAPASSTIDGGPGNDILVGGPEADRFVFDSPLNRRTNVDHITNFQHSLDKIALSRHIFGAHLVLNAHSFYAALGANAAADADDRIIYNKTTGALYFDRDGAGGAAAIKFAVLDTHPANLSFHDFVVIA